MSLTSPARNGSESYIGTSLRRPEVSLADQSEYRVAHRRLTSYKSTAISPDGKWLACATRNKVRIFPLELLTTGQVLDAHQVIRASSLSNHEKIQEVALSQSLIAILTSSSLFVFEINCDGKVEMESTVHDKLIDLGTWIPHSLKIFEREWIDPRSRSSGWIAVGGEGETALRIFSLSWGNCWTMNGRAIALKCNGNIGSAKFVTFSPTFPNEPNHPLVFGVNSSNDIYCWDLRLLGKKHELDVSWQPNEKFSPVDSVSK